MKITYHFNVLTVAMLVFILVGCENAELQKLATELQASRLELEKTKNGNKRLKKLNHEVKKNLQKIKFEYENLKILNTELEKWSGQLVKSYGPCVWYFSEYDRPLPHESMIKPTAQQLVQKLNMLFKESKSPEVILIEIKETTAYIKVSDEEHLTQRMGTSGAASY
ncbi:MAG: hypothetical protein GY699_20450, partial [Desulfobacteraceae bacterium]|nr:hypothetical protein [Desulfobacteraceae bacterium]